MARKIEAKGGARTGRRAARAALPMAVILNRDVLTSAELQDTAETKPVGALFPSRNIRRSNDSAASGDRHFSPTQCSVDAIPYSSRGHFKDQGVDPRLDGGGLSETWSLGSR